MTPIQIRTKGQKLILVSSPPLYSGSINKNMINFILDATWVEEKDIQAKFYRDKDIENAVEAALINSSVTIPALPLEKKGKLYIGLVSYDEEKNTRLTTNLICLPIEQGTPINGGSALDELKKQWVTEAQKPLTILVNKLTENFRAINQKRSSDSK